MSNKRTRETPSTPTDTPVGREAFVPGRVYPSLDHDGSVITYEVLDTKIGPQPVTKEDEALLNQLHQNDFLWGNGPTGLPIAMSRGRIITHHMDPSTEERETAIQSRLSAVRTDILAALELLPHAPQMDLHVNIHPFSAACSQRAMDDLRLVYLPSMKDQQLFVSPINFMTMTIAERLEFIKTSCVYFTMFV